MTQIKRDNKNLPTDMNRVQSTQDNGRVVFEMVMANSIGTMEQLIKVNGEITRLMVEGDSYMSTVIFTMDNGQTIKPMAKGPTNT